jgi:ABC-2 type transport system permease protein
MTTLATTTVPVAGGHRPGRLAVFLVELRDEVRAIVREPTALVFSVLMPVGFFVLFNALFGQVSGDAGTVMVATYGGYGVLTVAALPPGISVAQDRELGWLRAKRVSAVPVAVTLAAKTVAAWCYAIGVLTLMALAAAGLGTLHAPVGALLRVAGVLVLGSVPFTLLSLAVGFRLRANAAAAVLNAVLMPASVASGLWIPLSIMPPVVRHIAVFLPTYHLGQLSLSQLTGGPVLGHVLVLLATTAVAAGLAALSYRRSRA